MVSRRPWTPELCGFDSRFPDVERKMKAKLTKMAGGKALRTAIVDGTCERLPEEGKPFVLIGAPLEEGLMRVVQTSPVVKVERPECEGEEYVLTTHTGSKYHVEILSR